MTDTPGDTSTGTTLTIDGATITEALDLAGDQDWYRVTLVAGQTYVFTTASLGGVNDTSVDTTLSLRNAAGVEVRFNDDYANPPGYFSRITFTATASGTYYLDVGGYNDGEVGGYTVKAQTTTPPVLAVYTNDQIASQLTNGYWGGASHHFNVAPGGTLTVNVTALGATEQTLALNALALWTDATGIAFQQVASGAQITFTNTQAGAFANASFSGGITSSATVNVESSWVTTYGSGTNSYSFQTYIHEIGHALGLGHGGNYNGSAAYPDDALYANDAWVTTIMSYFDPKFDNTYFGNQGFSYQFTVAPMAADVIAVNNLYGVRTTTRTGDTTYGFNNTSGRDIFDASLVPGVAVTVIDDGGNDTLDYSGFSQAQTLNLNPEAFSSTGGRTGNLVIARGSVIENAIGGSGNDSITGNAVANSLSGGLGNDTIAGGEGNDTLDGGGGTNTLDGGGGNDRIVVAAAGTGASVTGGTGTDVLAVSGAVSLAAMTGIEAIELSAGAALTLTGSQFNNGLPLAAAISSTGSASITVNMEASVLFISKLDSFSGTIAMTVNGTTGTDIMKLGNVAHTANGGDGIDQIKGGSGADTISGGAGIDRINGAGGADVLTGGADADVFKYANLSDSGIGVAADHITDFVIGTDRLNFVKIDPDALTAGDQAFAFIGTTAFHASGAAEIRYLSSGGNIVVQVDADGNGTADMEIVLNGLAGQTLTSAEFAL